MLCDVVVEQQAGQTLELVLGYLLKRRHVPYFAQPVKRSDRPRDTRGLAVPSRAPFGHELCWKIYACSSYVVSIVCVSG